MKWFSVILRIRTERGFYTTFSMQTEVFILDTLLTLQFDNEQPAKDSEVIYLIDMTTLIELIVNNPSPPPDLTNEAEKANLPVSRAPSLPIGGLDHELGLLRESIFMPLHESGLFEKLEIKPLVGTLLYGPPGTGMLSSMKDE